MSTYFNDIQAALDTRLASIAGSPPIAWPNIEYEPTGGTTYLRPAFLPAETLQSGLGSEGLDETNGIYQIDVVYKVGSGRSSLVDSVADHFKRGTVATYNGVNVRIRSVSIAPAIFDIAWHFVPVSVSFQTYTEAR
tara:strand:- start:52 stop:459 length:408 start_codon:yes stop_codon:yes gene_type:complete